MGQDGTPAGDGEVPSNWQHTRSCDHPRPRGEEQTQVLEPRESSLTDEGGVKGLKLTMAPFGSYSKGITLTLWWDGDKSSRGLGLRLSENGHSKLINRIKIKFYSINP